MNNYKTIVKDFQSWGEFMAYAADIPRNEHGYDRGPRENRRDVKEWCGVYNMGEAMEIARRGWPEGATLVRRITLPTVSTMVGSVEHADLGYDVTGAAFDVGEYLVGTPECWISPMYTATKPCITIMANTVSSCGIPARMLEMRGAAVAALVMTLQTAGYAVRIYKVECYPVDGYEPGPNAPFVCQRTLLSDDAGGPLDTDRLLFALAHPSATRMLGFMVGVKLAHKGWGDLVGRVNIPLPDDLGWKCDLYLPSVHLNDANWRDEASVIRWVATQYEALKVKEI